MDSLIRRTITCGACGSTVTMYDDVCGHCKSNLEPIGGLKHKLPSSRDNEFALADSEGLRYHVELFGELGGVYPDQIDHLNEVLKPMWKHGYKYRVYLLELSSLIGDYRCICMEQSTKRREMHLEIFKMLEAVYNSLTT